MKSGVRLYFGAFDRNLTSAATKMFSHRIYFIIEFYIHCTFKAICKNNVAISCITVEHKKLIPVKFNGSHTTLVNFIFANYFFVPININNERKRQ